MSSITAINSASTSSLAAMQRSNGSPTGGPNMAKAMSPVADLLGMSADELRASLKSGTSLNDLAAQKGVSHKDLVGAIAKGLKDAKPADAPAEVSEADLTEMAEKIAGGPPAHGLHAGGKADFSQFDSLGVNQASGLSELSKIVGIDETALRDGLTQGKSLSDILSSNGVNEKTLAGQLLQGVTLDTQA